jgi:prepilin-type N-terminal cleavage/methylation domain-containing protein
MTIFAPRLHLRTAAGFTLIELMLVVTVVGTIAAVAVPSLLRARGAAAEVSAVGSLRAIHGAQMTFASSCAAGWYAASIPILATPPKAGQPAFIGPEFKANQTDRDRYRIRLTVGPTVPQSKATCNGQAAGRSVGTFYVAADLLSATNGMVRRYFGVNQNGIMYESTKSIAVFYAGTPPAPARTLR